ncbi:hypothetical protein WME75_05015 [Sorangium sp. So ce1014]|uniref:hypothetical protein n=1 Tax=Sorangium sp. So ce1014 TaxID=3133326 RepID=UPI003F624CED
MTMVGGDESTGGRAGSSPASVGAAGAALEGSGASRSCGVRAVLAGSSLARSGARGDCAANTITAASATRPRKTRSTRSLPAFVRVPPPRARAGGSPFAAAASRAVARSAPSPWRLVVRSRRAAAGPLSVALPPGSLRDEGPATLVSKRDAAPGAAPL